MLIGCRTFGNCARTYTGSYWLGFLDNGREVGELDWSAIGGTWGVATSRLIGWEPPKESFTHPLFDEPLSRIADGKNKNGVVLAI